jgi:hypothetical protein
VKHHLKLPGMHWGISTYPRDEIRPLAVNDIIGEEETGVAVLRVPTVSVPNLKDQANEINITQLKAIVSNALDDDDEEVIDASIVQMPSFQVPMAGQ